MAGREMVRLGGTLLIEKFGDAGRHRHAVLRLAGC
jgi:hypothetical protein